MKVATDPAFLEAIANDPDVFAAVAPAGGDPVSLAERWSQTVALEFEDGGFVFEPAGDVWEVHTLFKRGAADTVAKCRQAMAWAFQHGARVVVTMIPRDLRHVRLYALRNGFELVQEGAGSITRAAGPVPMDLYALPRVNPCL